MRREGRVALDAAQEIVSFVQRLVVFRVRRDVGLRALVLLARIAREVPAQRGLAAGIGVALQIGRYILHHLDVRRDALGLDRAAGRCVVTRAGQPQRAVVAAERDDGLDGPFAERLRAEDGRALLILERTGDDLRGRGRAAVDENDQRLAVRQIA